MFTVRRVSIERGHQNTLLPSFFKCRLATKNSGSRFTSSVALAPSENSEKFNPLFRATVPGFLCRVSWREHSHTLMPVVYVNLPHRYDFLQIHSSAFVKVFLNFRLPKYNSNRPSSFLSQLVCTPPSTESKSHPKTIPDINQSISLFEPPDSHPHIEAQLPSSLLQSVGEAESHICCP